MTTRTEGPEETQDAREASQGGDHRRVWRRLRRRPVFWGCVVVLGVLLAMAIAPSLFAGWFGNPDPRACALSDSVAGPRPGHPFGSDRQGCDVWSNVVVGTRASLVVGLLCTAVALLVALVLGTLAGLRGGWADRIIARLTDVFLGFPFLLGAIVVLNSVGARTAVTVALTLALFAWPTMARLVRSSVRSVRDEEYVQSARAMGLSPWLVVSRHVIPNAMGPVLAIATITVGQVIVAESTLTFLGVGLAPPAVSWGLQLAAASQQLSNAPHVVVFPALFLGLTVLSLISLGDVLRDALDPRRQ